MADWDKFGKSWFGVIFNPAGYMAQRKSAPRAAGDYLSAHPVEKFLFAGMDSEAYTAARIKWVNACASQLKSDDVGKTKANATSACQSAFDNTQFALDATANVATIEMAEEEAARANIEQRTKILMGFIMVTVAALIIYLIASKVFKS